MICAIIEPMLEMDDKQLIKRYFKGESKALEILIKRHVDAVYGFALSYVKSQAEAEDIAQETFIKVWKKLKQYDQDKSFRAWLMTITKNTALDYLKKRRAVPFSSFETEAGENILLETYKSDLPSPQEEMMRSEMADEMNEIRSALSPKYQKVLDLKIDNDFTFREISLALMEPLNTVKSRYRRALEALGHLLEDPKNG